MHRCWTTSSSLPILSVLEATLPTRTSTQTSHSLPTTTTPHRCVPLTMTYRSATILCLRQRSPALLPAPAASIRPPSGTLPTVLSLPLQIPAKASSTSMGLPLLETSINPTTAAHRSPSTRLAPSMSYSHRQLREHVQVHSRSTAMQLT